MPKIHDLCQIFAEETLQSLGKFPLKQRGAALALIYHEVENDLRLRHPDAEIIAKHLWLVLSEILDNQNSNANLAIMNDDPLAETEALEPFNDSFREDDIALGYAMDYALRSSRRLFRTLDKPLMPL